MPRIPRPAIVLLALALLATFTACGREAAESVSPEVLNVTPYQALIAWETKTPGQGEVLVKPAAGGRENRVREDLENVTLHEATLKGLIPGTRYAYRIKGQDAWFQFQAQPEKSVPFSFLAVFGEPGGKMTDYYLSAAPEFAVSLTPQKAGTPDIFGPIRPYLPVFGPSGPDSPILLAMGQAGGEEAGFSAVDWGGLRLVFLNTPVAVDRDWDAPGAHTLGFVAPVDLVLETGGPETVLEAGALARSPFHWRLVGHNKENPSRRAAFVLVPGAREGEARVDDITYAGVPAGASGALRVDVDVESVRAVFLDQGREIVLKEPPAGQKITCDDCRRLADKGAYERAVAAYKDFIRENQGNFQIDDAYFAIAKIYDENLFQYTEAEDWYRKLVDAYPGSSLAPLARIRLEQFMEYGPADREILARFERIQKVEYGRKKHLPEERDRLFSRMEALAEENGESPLAPRILYWVANQLRETDTDRAVALYRKIIRDHPASPQTREALVEIGDAFYSAGRWKEARQAYVDSLAVRPDLLGALTAQINRCQRNIRRDRLALGAAIILALFALASILKKPAGFRGLRLFPFALAFILTGGLLLGAGLLIREQFLSPRQMAAFSLGFPVAAVLSALFAKNLVGKFSANGAAARLWPIILGLTSFVCASYLLFYIVNIHYLIVFGL